MTELSNPQGTERRAGVVHDFAHGMRVGNYRLLELLGEGGFGSVWSAQQDVPVRRVVAIKILKLGMDTKQVVARFESERQALAVMEHPWIAKVLDGGATETGRPYFVMELVKGIPITSYCDEAKLPIRARLEIFRDLCSAVQHAHQKGIIHRDLKPSNILVELQDGAAQPKIIDFGVAKAVTAPLTDSTLVTEIGQMIGTPDYMAPEQAENSGLDVDTRADVYSLGVVLYELLTGTKPFELRQMVHKGYAELVRIIRDVEPPKPSTRVSSLGETRNALARSRSTSHDKLGRTLKGDLDWIVTKAMEKERSNRYATAAALAEDIERYLDHRPVSAAPPSAAHRVRKYVRRHRFGVAAASAIALSLIAGLVASALGYWEARSQRDAAQHAETVATTQARRAEQVIEILSAVFQGADPYEGLPENYTLRELLEHFDADLVTRVGSDPEVEATVHRILGRAFRGSGDSARAGKHFTAAHDIYLRIAGPEAVPTLESSIERMFALYDMGDNAAAEAEARADLEVVRRVAPDSELLAKLLYGLGTVVSAGAQPLEGVPYLREALALRERISGPNHEQTGNAMFALARALMTGSAEEQAEAEQLFLGRIQVLRVLSQPDHPNVAMALDNLGRMALARGDAAGAEKYLRDAIDIQRRRLGNDHPDLATSLCTLANMRREAGALDEAESLLTEAENIYRKRLGDDHPDFGVAIENHAIVKRDRGDLDGAERMLVDALAIFQKRLEPDHPSVTATLSILASVQRSRGDFRGAEQSYREMNRLLLRNHAPDSAEVTSSASSIAVMLVEQSYADHAVEKAREAEELLREAVALRMQSLGEDDWRTAMAQNQLADALAAQDGKLEEARTLALESWPRLSKEGGMPDSIRPVQLRYAAERVVRVLEASSRAVPGSVDESTLTEWKSRRDSLR